MIERKRRGRLVSARREVAEQNRIRNSYERRLVGQLTVLFENIAETTVREYQVGGSPAVRFENVTNRISEVLVPHYRSVILAMADRFQTVKVKQDYERIVQAYLRFTATDRIVGISTTTQNLIKRALLEADQEINPRQAAKLIEERVGGAFGRRRAATIARTETHAAASYANHEVAKDLGVPMRKQWVATNDDRSRTWHSSVNGQTVDLDEDFIVPYKGVDYRMKHTGDPNGGAHNTINCRCVTIYLEPEDVVVDDQPKPPEAAPVGDDKPFIDMSPLVQELSRGSAGADAFTKKLNDALTPLTANVASRLPRPERIIETKGRNAWQMDGVIKSHLRYEIFEHEYGHHVDLQLGIKIGSASLRGDNRYWSRNGLKEAWENDRKSNNLHLKAERDDKIIEMSRELFDVEEYEVRGFTRERLVPKFEGATAISDIIDSMTAGYYRSEYNAWGHSISYWRRAGVKQMETFANLHAIQNAPKALAFVKKNFPELQARFESAMQEFVDTGDIT